MTPTQTDTLLGAVKDLRDDMGRRFEDVRCDFVEVKGQLKLVDGRISKIEVGDAVSAALLIQAKVIADSKVAEAGMSTLAYRWRVGIVIAAASALVGVLISLYHIATGA